MDRRSVSANGDDLCVQEIGRPADAPILLIMGRAASMDWWEDGFCERLVGASRFVVRYDHRDTGRSVSYEVGAPGYTGGDLVGDALRVLDALEVPTAHIVGFSMGGGLAQMIGLDHPDRLRSLTLISTSPVTGDHSDLPAMSEEASAAFAVAEPDWSDRTAVIGYLLELGQAAASPARAFEEAEYRDLVSRALDRTDNLEASMKNHDVIAPAPPPAGRLEDLHVPTLVIHGHDDPVFPVEHGRALQERIPDARLLIVERMGHELPRAAWDEIVPAIVEHTARP